MAAVSFPREGIISHEVTLCCDGVRIEVNVKDHR